MIILILLLVLATFSVFAMAFRDPNKNLDIKSRMMMATKVDPGKTATPQKKGPPEKVRLQKGNSPLLALISKKLGSNIKAFMPEAMYQKYATRLIVAGMDMKVSELMAMKCILAVVFLVVGGALVAMQAKSGSLTSKSVLTMLGAGLFGFFLPDLQMRQNAQKRQNEVEKMLPFTLDLLKICVEAGLDLNSAFGRVVQKTKGPLAEELGKMISEIRMGKHRAQAMVDVGKRVDQPDLSSFITIVVQGEKTGMSMGRILSMQSEQIRLKRSQRVREHAAKIPVKMMIPMVLFILPAMFLVLLGPAVIKMVNNFS